MSYYTTLGLTASATLAELKNAYQSLIMKLHPDFNAEGNTTDEFQAIHMAFSVLGNSVKRAEYDESYGASRFFGKANERPIRPTSGNRHDVLLCASKAFEAMGYFAYMQDLRAPANRQRGAVEMMEEIDWYAEQAKHYSSPELYVEVALALRLYSVWYCHTSLGEDKAMPLDKAVRVLELAIDVASVKSEYELHLATLLTVRPQVRDLNRARQIVERVAKGIEPKLKSHLASLSDMINRFDGTPSFNPNFSYSKMTYLPIGSFYEERKNCRAVIRAFKKGGDMETLRPVLEHLYRIAILGESAGAIMARSEEDDHAKHVKHLKRSIPLVKKMTYGSHGVLKMSWQWKPVLSTADYKTFEALYGKSDKQFNPHTLLDFNVDESLRQANERAETFRHSKIVSADVKFS